MSQGNGNPQTKSSRVLKNTCSAVYKEAVMFLVSTKKVDLLNTKISIAVHDISRLAHPFSIIIIALRSMTGDDIIGSSYLGSLATDKSEIEQWKNTIEHLGKEYKGSHQLKAPNQPPNVHVSETQDDNEYGEDEGED
jgi:hypothetical protein